MWYRCTQVYEYNILLAFHSLTQFLPEADVVGLIPELHPHLLVVRLELASSAGQILHAIWRGSEKKVVFSHLHVFKLFY